jgi:hypothetical protein
MVLGLMRWVIRGVLVYEVFLLWEEGRLCIGRNVFLKIGVLRGYVYM